MQIVASTTFLLVILAVPISFISATAALISHEVNHNADLLSRMLEYPNCPNKTTLIAEPSVYANLSSDALQIVQFDPLENLIKLQRDDSILGLLCQFLTMKTLLADDLRLIPHCPSIPCCRTGWKNSLLTPCPRLSSTVLQITASTFFFLAILAILVSYVSPDAALVMAARSILSAVMQAPENSPIRPCHKPCQLAKTIHINKIKLCYLQDIPESENRETKHQDMDTDNEFEPISKMLPKTRATLLMQPV